MYAGIQYNDNINETGSWKDDYTIYVEQEILFHMAGYNGVLYQQLFQDFMGLVEEINRKAHKQLIKIKYFDSVRFEIESYFNNAERIVDGKETLDCSKIAMTTIVQGCENKSDVIAKKCAFFDLMKKKQIINQIINRKIFYTVEKAPDRDNNCENLICDVRTCPVCHMPIEYEYIQFHLISE